MRRGRRDTAALGRYRLAATITGRKVAALPQLPRAGLRRPSRLCLRGCRPALGCSRNANSVQPRPSRPLVRGPLGCAQPACTTRRNGRLVRRGGPRGALPHADGVDVRSRARRRAARIAAELPARAAGDALVRHTRERTAPQRMPTLVATRARAASTSACNHGAHARRAGDARRCAWRRRRATLAASHLARPVLGHYAARRARITPAPTWRLRVRLHTRPRGTAFRARGPHYYYISTSHYTRHHRLLLRVRAAEA